MKTVIAAGIMTGLACLNGALAQEGNESAGLEALVLDDAVTVTDGGEPVFTWRTAPAEGTERWRANYMHPLHAPSGTVITEDAPDDHPHHRGIYWAWRHITVNGEDIGDAWEGRSLYWKTEPTGHNLNPDGSLTLDLASLWYSDIAGPPMPVLREATSITVATAPGRTELEIETAMTALVDGLEIAGTDDAKGYGGMSFRFGHPEAILIEDRGETIEAIEPAVTTGEEITFRWSEAPEGWPGEITVSCHADDAPVTEWIFRQWLSLQSCVYPGQDVVTVPTDGALRLSARVTIKQ